MSRVLPLSPNPRIKPDNSHSKNFLILRKMSRDVGITRQCDNIPFTIKENFLKLNLTVLAKSDKHMWYRLAGIDQKGNFIRLVWDVEGHALTKEQ